MDEHVVENLIVELRMRTSALEQGLATARASLESFANRAKQLSSEEAAAVKAAAEASLQAAKEAAEQAARAKEEAAERARLAWLKAEQSNSEADIQAALEAKKLADQAAREEISALNRVEQAHTELRDAEKEAARAAAREVETAAQAKAEAEKRAAEEAKRAAEIGYAAMAAAATVAMRAIVSAVSTAIEAYNEYASALVGLRSLAEGTGQSMAELQEAVESLTADGLMTAADAASALKNLLARGFSAEEAIDMLERLKDAAAFGRQASLSLGEAVRSAAEGIKNENSILVDNAGVTKNVSVMWKEYAASIGKTVDSLTLAEKRQAEYNGIMAETKYQVGDAAKYAAEFAGQQAALEAATLRVSQAFGSVMADALTPLYEALTPIVQAIADFIEKNPELTAGIVAATVAIGGITGAISLWTYVTQRLTEANIALQTSMGWIGVVGLALGALVGIGVAASNAAKEAKNASQNLKELQESARGLTQDAKDAAEAMRALEGGAASTDELAAAKNRLAEIFPELVIGYDAEGNAILAGTELIRERIRLLQEQAKLEQQAARDAAIAAEEAAKQKQAEVERKLRELDEKKAEYERKLATGDTTEYFGMGSSIDKAREYQEWLNSYEERRLELLKEQNDAQIQIQAAAMARYQTEIAALGELSEAQQLIIEQEVERALQEGLTAERFAENIQAAINDTQRLASAQAELAAKNMEAASSVKELASAEEALTAAREAGAKLQTAKQMQEYVKVVRQGKTGTEEYKNAVAKLKEQYGDLYPNVEENIDAIGRLADADAAMAEQSVQNTRTAINNLYQATMALWKVQEAGSAARQELARVLQQLADLDAGLKLGLNISAPSGGGSSTRGGGSRKKTWWEKELEELEHLANMGEDVANRQIEAYERILKTAKLTTDERWDLEEKLYAAQKELIQKQLDAKLELYSSIAAMDKEEVESRISVLEQILRREDLTAQERAKYEEELNQYRLASDGDYLEDYIKNLEEQLKNDRLSADQRQQVWEAYTDARLAQIAQIKEAEADALDYVDELLSQITTVLKGRYEAQRNFALDALNAQKQAAKDAADAQIKAIESVRDAQVKAIDDQIAALDELLKARKQQKEDENDEDQLNRLKAALEYEKDAYNRAALAKQIADKEAEISEKKWERDIEAQKDALKKEKDLIKEQAARQIEAIKESSERMQKYYADQIAATQKHYATLLDARNLMKEAMKLLASQEQDEILNILKEYQTEYADVGDLLGGELLKAFQGKFDEIKRAAEAMVNEVKAKMSEALGFVQPEGDFGYLSGSISSRAAGNVTVIASAEQGTKMPYEVYVDGRKVQSGIVKAAGG